MTERRTVGPLAGLGSALLLSGVFLLFSYSHTLLAFQEGFGGHRILESVLQESIWGTALARDLLLYVGAELVLHLLLAVLIFGLARLTLWARPAVQATPLKLVAAWFVLCAFWILLANAVQFPHSAISPPFHFASRPIIAGVTLFAVVTSVLALLIVWLLVTGSVAALGHPGGKRKVAIGAVGATLCTVAATLVLWSAAGPEIARAQATAGQERPNIVIIGIDSLRADLAANEEGRALIPAIRSFLDESVRFHDATTPLARTFPAWIALLTGRHPHTTGAIVNLLPREMINEGRTLPDLMRAQGYRTVYAIDEVRFSNLDASYGFDKAITPPMGAADFVIGQLNDVPWSNLFVNTPVGSWLFPYTHANRGAAVTYRPDAFVARLERELPAYAPMLLAVHLTLPHWPFYWADAPVAQTVQERHEAVIYRNCLRRVDAQFASVLRALRERGVLDNALVLVVSDHGEALGDPSESLVDADSPYAREIQSAVYGHGTSVLSPGQYRTVLALRTFGPSRNTSFAPRWLGGQVTLEDVAPSILDYLDIATAESFDGRSFWPLLQGDSPTEQWFEARTRYTETEFMPAALVAGRLVTDQDAIRETVTFYRIDPESGRLSIRRDRLDKVLETRQFAAMHGEALLAAIPDALTYAYRYVYFSHAGAEPRIVTSIPPGNADPLLALLWNDLHARFPQALARKPASVAAPGRRSVVADTR